ncbi:MAG: cyclic nucleotide-binding domain-containing protein [Candidatus Micropelagos sp.]|nr:cyclic nucleotide-binding domain-containing protein [Candidatus Micropelagos sp.]NCG10244.1 cyclic nucleotide-binding domain-containing protein [Alphaproteobacteria bacterium]
MQSKADDIKERAKYLRDMLAEYADDETVWLDNEDDMDYFADEPVPEATKKVEPLPQNIETEVTSEMAPAPATHPLIMGHQEDETETPYDNENENKSDNLKSEDIDKHLANILADVPSRNDGGDPPANNKKIAENNPSDRFEKIAKVIADSENTASILPTEMPKTPNVDEKGRKIFKSKATLKILNEMGREIEIGKLNDSMISKGTPLNACYCILEGRVRYYDALTNEYLLGEGSLIGAAEVLAPNKIHFDYRTEGYVKVAIIDFSIIKSAIDKLRPLTRGIIKYTHDRVMGQKERSSHHLVDDQFINQLDRYNHFNIKEGEVLFDAGDKSDTFFYISDGSMNVVDENGKVLANLTSGQSFGEIAALTGMPRTAKLVAKTETDLFEVRSSDVARELSFEPPVIKLIVRGIINQLIINN